MKNTLLKWYLIFVKCFLLKSFPSAHSQETSLHFFFLALYAFWEGQIKMSLPFCPLLLWSQQSTSFMLGWKKWMNAISPSGVMVIAFIWTAMCNVYGICNEDMYTFQCLCIYTYIHIHTYLCMYALKCVIRWWCGVECSMNIMWGKKIWKLFFFILVFRRWLEFPSNFQV